jgi:hypothetical protein
MSNLIKSKISFFQTNCLYDFSPRCIDFGMKDSLAADVLYYKMFSITINIDIIRQKKENPRFIKQQIHTHRLFFVIKQ